MGVLGIVPFLLKKCPQIVENIPSRFYGLEGKTIAIDGTLVTQRLHFTPDPRPHRHVLGWYQLIAELRQHDIKVICVFDGKHRIPAKLEEVTRRRQLRLQAETRAIWEKSRHERLLSLTEVLMNLESLPQDQQQDIIASLKSEAEPSSPPQLGDKEFKANLALDPSLVIAQQGPVDVCFQRVSKPLPLDAPPVGESKMPSSVWSAAIDTSSNLPAAQDPPNTSGSVMTSSSDVENGMSNATKDRHPTDKLVFKDSPSPERNELDTLEGPLSQGDLSMYPRETSSIENRGTLRSKESHTFSATSRAGVPGISLQPTALGDSLSVQLSNAKISEAPAVFEQSTGGSQSATSTHDEANSELDLPAGINDNQYLARVIRHLHEHYTRTSTASADGFIRTRSEPDDESLLDIPISRVQLKYTQEESQLWEKLVPTSEDSKVDIANVVEQVKQLASVALPEDEHDPETLEGEIGQVSEQEEASEEIAQVSEWAATLEEQSGLMAASLTRRANPPSSSTYAESRLILEVMGVPCIESPMHYEAEALASSIVINGLADLVGSEDTDVLLYNAPLLRHMTNKKVPLQIIPPNTQNDLGLSRSAFVDAGILMGTDFVRRLNKIGPITAFRLMQKYGSVERMLEEEPKFRPPDVADYLEKVKVARLIFSSLPPVPSPESIAQGDWDEQAIQETMAHFGLIKHMKEIEEQLIPDALSDNYFNEGSKESS